MKSLRPEIHGSSRCSTSITGDIHFCPSRPRIVGLRERAQRAQTALVLGNASAAGRGYRSEKRTGEMCETVEKSEMLLSE